MESASHIGQALIPGVNGFPGTPLPVALQSEALTGSCIHFWVIESPNGPTSIGTCKLCTEVREFRNSMYSSTWSKGMVKRGDGWEAA